MTETNSQLNAIGAAIEEIAEAVLIADIDDPLLRLSYVNRAFEAVTGYSREEAIGKNCRYLQGDDRLQPEIAEMRTAIDARRPIALTLRNYRKDGNLFWNALRLFPVFDRSGRATHFVGLMRDATKDRQTSARLDRAEQLDQLTGSLNRYVFAAQLDKLLSDSNVLVLKANVANFYDVNSGYGYDAGDMLLQQIAERLSALGAPLIARVGGDEFAIACALDRPEDAARWLERIKAALSAQYRLPDAILDVRFAIGFVIGKRGAEAIKLIRQAGTALHHSKTTRLRQPEEFGLEDEMRARNRLRLTSELQKAVANSEFLFHYQPKIDLRSGALVGAEALLRWQHGVFGLQRPSHFIGLTEETGLILDIGHWGRREVARFAATVNRDRAKPLHFSVNVSTVELTHRDLVASVKEALAASGADPAWLTLELTETVLAQAKPELLAIFGRLRDLGVGLSIDDFGTGYSSLGYLESFPITEIKLDKSFVQDLQQSRVKQFIVDAVIKLGTELDISVTAEGVETEAERSILQELHCPFGQGYLFGRPMAADDFLRLIGG